MKGNIMTLAATAGFTEMVPTEIHMASLSTKRESGTPRSASLSARVEREARFIAGWSGVPGCRVGGPTCRPGTGASMNVFAPATSEGVVLIGIRTARSSGGDEFRAR
jgi:hypothetical protein